MATTGDADGASPRERVLEACRRDQLHLIEEVLEEMQNKPPKEVADFFNNVQTSMGDYALHVCAQSGSYDVMDCLFDIEYLECDPKNRSNADTPLHTAVRAAASDSSELPLKMVQMMCLAGCDPRVRNKHGLKAAQLVNPGTANGEAIKKELGKGEYMMSQNVQQQNNEADDDGPPSDDE